MIYQVMNIKAETYEEPAKLYLYLLEKSPEIGIADLYLPGRRLRHDF